MEAHFCPTKIHNYDIQSHNLWDKISNSYNYNKVKITTLIRDYETK